MTEQNAKILLLGPGPLDQKMKAFSSTAQALAAIPVWQREIGQRVTVVESGVAKLYWFETGIADGDLVLFPVGAGGGDFIPLAGTETGKPVTGDIEFDMGIVIKAYEGTEYGIIGFEDSSPIIIKNTGDGNFGLRLTSQGIELLTSTNESFEGIYANEYLGSYYTDNSFIQKQYVDDKIISTVHQSISIINDEANWDLSVNINAKLTCGGDFSLLIGNIENGMSGALTIDCLAATVITLDTGLIPAKGNGSLTLTEGYYVFAFLYDGTNFFWNIAAYA